MWVNLTSSKCHWLTQRAQEVSAFITHSGLFSNTVMGFGLRNAPAMFQNLMNIVVMGLKGCAVYLDDVVVYSNTWDVHLQQIWALFDRLAKGKLTLNPTKCKFAIARLIFVKLLGKVTFVQLWLKSQQCLFPILTTEKELMAITAVCVVALLTDLFKGNSMYIWSPICQQALMRWKPYFVPFLFCLLLQLASFQRSSAIPLILALQHFRVYPDSAN